MQTTERPQARTEVDPFAALIATLNDDQVKALANALESGSGNPLETYFDWCDRAREELNLRKIPHDHP